MFCDVYACKYQCFFNDVQFCDGHACKYQCFYWFQDGLGQFFADSNTNLYWVSFLDGMQRVLLFTEDIALATVAQQVRLPVCLPVIT